MRMRRRKRTTMITLWLPGGHQEKAAEGVVEMPIATPRGLDIAMGDAKPEE